MAKTSYQTTPDQRLVTPAYKPSPSTGAQITSRGSESHPVPPAPVKFTKKLLPAPSLANQPGASGTI